MHSTDTGTSEQLDRPSGGDVAQLDGIGSTACREGQPANSLTQRQIFKQLMPRLRVLRVLRERGWSWAQLAELLKRAGIDLAPNTVRTYYAHMNTHD